MSDGLLTAIRDGVESTPQGPVFPVKRAKSRYPKPSRTTCGKPGCENPRRHPKQRYCRSHHAAYMHQWRQDHPHSGTRRRG